MGITEKEICHEKDGCLPAQQQSFLGITGKNGCRFLGSEARREMVTVKSVRDLVDGVLPLTLLSATRFSR